jgi:hypothetical protein
MFPCVRVKGAEIDAFAESAALEDPGGDVPESTLERGLDLVDAEQRAAVVASWVEPYADRWASLTRAAGDPGAAEDALVRGALRAAIAERQETPVELVRELDDGALRRSPFAVLSLAVPPMFVWSVDEARAAQVAAAQRGPRRRADAVQEVAYALMTFIHTRRTTALVVRLAAELPFAGLPEATRTIGDACEEVERRLVAARATTAALLIAYVEQRRNGA